MSLLLGEHTLHRRRTGKIFDEDWKRDKNAWRGWRRQSGPQEHGAVSHGQRGRCCVPRETLEGKRPDTNSTESLSHRNIFLSLVQTSSLQGRT